MDRVSRCPHCGKRLVPEPSGSGRTELKCLFCDQLDPLEVLEAKKWADSPLARDGLLDEFADNSQAMPSGR
jgi:phage FluMu protein Com